MDAQLTDNIVLVTGASGGTGGEIARGFAKEGARVVLHYRRNRPAAVALAEKLPPGRAVVLGADLTDEGQVIGLFDEAERTLGPIDTVVANAGIWTADAAPLQQMTLAQWNDTIMTDLTSVFLVMRQFLRTVERHSIERPCAVLIGSTAGIFGEADHADYAAAKSGLVYGFMLSVKNELARLAPQGRINAVCPGWTATPMAADALQDTAAVARTLQTVSLRKIATPADIAPAVVFLASPSLAGHITGQVLVVAGGMEGRVLYGVDEVGK